MPRRYKKYRARTSSVYEKPWRGKHVEMDCMATGIYRRSAHEELPSKGVTMGIDTAKRQEELTAEMKEREAIARVESERRKKMIAPMYNKGAYQYIGGVDKAILHDIGKKK